jgi:hypothetical protein
LFVYNVLGNAGTWSVCVQLGRPAGRLKAAV